MKAGTGVAFILASVGVHSCTAIAIGCTVGIDLGTTNSAIAVLRDGQPLMVPNRHGETTTPSVVAYTAGGVLVGRDALDQAAANPKNTIIGAKRFIGKQLSSVRIDAARAAFDVGDDECGMVFLCPGAPAPLAPESVGAELLLELLRDAERFVGEPVARAVVTVPAYFNAVQRDATHMAATLAGLRDISILAEPVAASLAYGLGGSTGTVVVFDLGAGTFDVSVLDLQESGDVEVGRLAARPRHPASASIAPDASTNARLLHTACLAARRTPHAARRTPHAARRTPHTAHPQPGGQRAQRYSGERLHYYGDGDGPP